MDNNKLFLTDKQTLEDLNLLGKYKSDSIFSLFNRTKTKGGEEILTNYFEKPLVQIDVIRERQNCISAVVGQKLQFPLNAADFDVLEQYINGYASINKVGLLAEIAKRNIMQRLGDTAHYTFHNNLIIGSLNVLNILKQWFESDLTRAANERISVLIARYLPALQDITRVPLPKDQTLSIFDQLRLEQDMRIKYHSLIKQLVLDCYVLDAHIAIASVKEDSGFTFPVFVDQQNAEIRLTGAYHPAIQGAIANTLDLDSSHNLLFLTGANMAGKSTMMKTIGVNLYLAQMGFPVPATQFELTVFEGIYTSINVPDNLNAGYSHFYAEVLRVKEVATEVASGKRLLVIFDELFKGTNVKDAFEATYEVSKALIDYKTCVFVLSTHIVEVGHALQEVTDGIKYQYMPTIMQGTVATYPYTLCNGISDDRHGMMIIKQEGILDLFI